MIALATLGGNDQPTWLMDYVAHCHYFPGDRLSDFVVGVSSISPAISVPQLTTNANYEVTHLSIKMSHCLQFLVFVNYMEDISIAVVYKMYFSM